METVHITDAEVKMLWSLLGLKQNVPTISVCDLKFGNHYWIIPNMRGAIHSSKSFPEKHQIWKARSSLVGKSEDSMVKL